MTEIPDAGVRSAIEQATGHSTPHSSRELAALTTLRVRHAEDLSALRLCPGLTALELTACDVGTLDEPAQLPQLSTLHVLGCPIEDASALAARPALTELRLDFGFLENIMPLTRIPNLRRGRIVGNPIDEESWHDVRPAWSRSRTADTDRLRLLEFGPTGAWEYARAAWEEGVRLCFGILDGVRPMLVRPGRPQAGGLLMDITIAFGAAVVAAARRGDPADTIFRANSEWAAQEGWDVPTDFASHRVLGDATDALAWTAEATGPDRQAFERFVAHFPDSVFVREDETVHAAIAAQATVPMPGRVAASRSILAGLLTDDRVTFRLDRANPAGDVWHLPGPGRYSGHQRTALIRDQAGLFPLAEWIETGRSVLAARLGDDDPAIYEFDADELSETQAMGQPLDTAVHRVFASHADLLSHIAAYRNAGGSEAIAATTDNEEAMTDGE